MEQLVDTIIKTSFFELDDVEFPLNELFGLVIEYENFNYEFLLKVVENCSTLTVMSSSAFNKDTNYDRSRPWFNRWSWPFEGSLLYYHDPTLYLADDIYAPWGVGTPDVWYLKQISIIVSKISHKINVYNDEILFYGSSAGGFCSLALSIFVKNSIALADIPQFDVTKFGSHWKAIKNASFDMYDDETFIKKYNERLNIMTLIRKENYVPNAYIILDCSFDTDFKKQYHLFLKELYKFNYVTDGNSMKAIILGQNNGHNPQPRDKILYFIKQIKQIEYFKKNPAITLNKSIESDSILISNLDGYEEEFKSQIDYSKIDEKVDDNQSANLNKNPVKISIVTVNHLADRNLIIVKGNIKDINNNPVKNKDIKLNVILQENTMILDAFTDSRGYFLFVFNIKEDVAYKLYVLSPENNLYSETVSEKHLVNTKKINTIVCLKANLTEVIVDQIVTLTATVTDEDNNVIKNMIVNIYDENDKLVAQEITNSHGQVMINKKLTDAKMNKFYAKALVNRKYNGNSNKNTISVNTIKHSLNSTIEESTIECGSKAYIHIQNESLKPTKNTKFLIQINDDVQNIISDENGFIITPPFNKVGIYNLKISFNGNIKYNSFTKVYTIHVK